MTTTNDYSDTWFALYSQPIDAAQTERDAAFIAQHLPLDRFPRVLDLCCGQGRHSAALTHRGYAVTGVDRNPGALQVARARCAPPAEFVVMDARHVAALGRRFDGVVCMWQSFGYFDAAQNARLLRDLSGVVEGQGRMILDVYNADFFRDRQGLRSSQANGVNTTERKLLVGDRLHVEITYDDTGKGDAFEWQVFDPDAICRVLNDAGWSVLVRCRGFDDALAPSCDHARMQLVAETSPHRQVISCPQTPRCNGPAPRQALR